MRTLSIIGLLALLSCSNQKESLQQSEALFFAEKHRPQFHFSPETSWMNDPNGMFFHEGEYHLFYQYYPDSNVWGPMHWGHAVSKDMISWEHLPIALYPDSLGYIFSGSAVVDKNNTSGLGAEGELPLVAIFTYHDPKGVEKGAIDYQSQGMAYSLDKGRSWTKYEGNPVLPNPGILDFRDPKVFWHEASQKWIMALAVLDHISFYSSPNLISWEKESDFGYDWGSFAGVWECPDLFEMPIENSDEKKWILLVSINSGGPQGGSATQYFVGDFDGKEFSLDESFKSELKIFPVEEEGGKEFENFESGYGDWITTGTAFGETPVDGSLGDQEEVEGIIGKYFVNSFHGGNESTGTLSSPFFTIEDRYINLKIGGGNHFATVFAGLYVDDKLVRRSMGNNSERLKSTSWNVEEFVGKRAQIKIIDNHTSGMGHVLVDQIEFSDEPAWDLDKAMWLDYGADSYAGVTWNNVPRSDGRRLFLGWMSNWEYAQIVPTLVWRSAMTLPRELTLHTREDSYRLHSKPVNELNDYLGPLSKLDIEEAFIDSTFMIGADLSGDFDIKLLNEVGEYVTLSLQEDRLIFDRSNSGETAFSVEFTKRHIVPIRNIIPQKLQIYVDTASIEIFINDGELVMTELVFPTTPYSRIKVEGGYSDLTYRTVERAW